MNFNTKSVEENFGSRVTSNDDSCKPVGELFIESFDVQVITWKIPKIRSFTVEVDKGVKSPSFPFAGASWILTMFPYGQTKFKSERKVDLIIDRLYSLFPKHPVSYKIFFKAYDKEFDEKGYRLEDFGETIDRGNFTYFQANNTRENSFISGENNTRENSFIFEANNTRENICNVVSYSDLFSSVAPNRPCDTAFLVCDFRTKTITWKRLDILSKSHQLDTGPSQSTPKEEPLTLASSCKESSQKASREEPVRLFGGCSLKKSSQKASRDELVRLFGGCSLKKSSQKTPREEPVAPFGGFSSKEKEPAAPFGGFSFKGSLQKTSKEEPVAQFSGFSFKGPSQKTPKEEPATSFSGFSFKGHGDEPGESVELPSKKFLSDMKELFLKQEDCDVILKVKEREFPAHRLILKARSPVFASTFKYDTKEKATGVIDIEDCDPSSFSDFLYFLYCGTSEKLSSKNVFSLFTAADKYDVQDLRSEGMKFIKKNLSIDNFCDAIVLALKHSEKELIELTTDFFRKNLQKIILTVKWQSFLIENPIQGNELLIKALSLNKT